MLVLALKNPRLLDQKLPTNVLTELKAHHLLQYNIVSDSWRLPPDVSLRVASGEIRPEYFVWEEERGNRTNMF